MKKLPSFEVNHLDLLSGIYVSRYDQFNDCTLTTFDLRFVRPNVEKVLSTGVIHTIEHLGATFLRNHASFQDKIVYFGPMGCRTGFYLIVYGKFKSRDIVSLIIDMLKFIIDFNDDIPGAAERDCGNYLDHDLKGAKDASEKFLKILENLTEKNLEYPN